MEDRFQNRTRFSLAHEIGHFVLHKKIYNQLHKQLPNLSIMECREFILNMSDYNNFEWQAHEFAGRLLVPRQQLIEEIRKIQEKVKRLSVTGVDPGEILSRTSPALRRVFGVSDQVIEKRVEREDLLHLLSQKSFGE